MNVVNVDDDENDSVKIINMVKQSLSRDVYASSICDACETKNFIEITNIKLTFDELLNVAKLNDIDVNDPTP